jgi:hypothetical protein
MPLAFLDDPVEALAAVARGEVAEDQLRAVVDQAAGS